MSHPCRNYCSQWTGEQCKGCTISDEVELQDPPAVEYCPHGYDTACLICGFGQKDGKRVLHNKTPKTQVVMRADELEITPYCVECDRKTLKVLHTANDAAYSKQRAKLRVEFWKTAFAISGCINLLLIAAAMVGGDL